MKDSLDELSRLDQENGRYAEIHNPMIKPNVVCLCGSTKFKGAFVRANKAETLKGSIVLSVGLFGHHEDLDMDGEVKAMLDQLHLRKIDIADEILVLNVNGYIGSSIRKEIDYAKLSNKSVRYLEPLRQE